MDERTASHLEYQHQPVFTAEVLSYLRPQPGSAYIDATFGGGGHTAAILGAAGDGAHVVGIDQNPRAVALGRRSTSSQVTVVQGNFSQLADLWRSSGCKLPLRGVLFDLGLASAELADPEWGFSFQNDAPLIMRFDGDPDGELTAAQVVNRWREDELADALRTYGQEPLARQIAAAIVRQRPVATTGQLADIVVRQYARRFGRSRRHPATRTFQALRIVVNDELEALRAGLQQAAEVLEPGGVAVVISYHSLEDGLVKRAFKSGTRWEPLTKKPLVPTEAEVAANPRARSAKLRAARRTE